MPNYCNYDMKIVGKKENVEEFIKVMKVDYNYTDMKFGFDRHMGGRVFDIYNEDVSDPEEDGIVEAPCSRVVDFHVEGRRYVGCVLVELAAVFDDEG